MWFDGEFIEDAQARVSPLSHSLHYGGAVYEGIRFYEFPHNFWRSVFRLQDHINRLLVSAQVMDMESPYGAEELCEAVLESEEERSSGRIYSTRNLSWRRNWAHVSRDSGTHDDRGSAMGAGTGFHKSGDIQDDPITSSFDQHRCQSRGPLCEFISRGGGGQEVGC